MSAWSKVRVHELGLRSSHTDVQRRRQKGKKVFSTPPTPLSLTHAYRQTPLTRMQKFIVSNHGLKFLKLCEQRHTSKKLQKRQRGKRDYCRAHKVEEIQLFLFSRAETHFPCSGRVYSKVRGSM